MTAWQRGALWVGLLALGAVLAPGADEAGKTVGLRQSASWALAEMPRKPDQAGVALSLATSAMFEAEAPSAAPGAAAPPPDERWRIAGVLGRGREAQVVVSFRDPSRPTQILRVGDALPSGHRVQAVEPGTVCVQVGRKILRIGVQALD
ncbi:hypothetical protein [Inhella crocodyli]|uniref:Type II secretion system protein GspC N-terminal domain-containing protein n=1 Tax=Inhella crocodyli TaxID=2499851 RepID=A0A3S2WUY5_9BURK|nr:hypothetical protein [Inhella crocodyli]RVT88585.1 hypothetical protein EOD73_06350 [Inhella crocodyli]